jgi:predicted transcriptional regulator
MTINLSDSVAKTIKGLADRQGVSVTEIIRRSIGVEMWRQDVEKSGGKVLVESPSGDVKVIEFSA